MQQVTRNAILKRINWINRLDGILSLLGVRLPKFSAEKLIKEAKRETGLNEFGSGNFYEGLYRLTESLNESDGSTLFERILAKRLIKFYLVCRLETMEYVRQHPEVLEQKIEKPIFILGMPRTGTTMLHHMLEEDPEIRAPLSWEAIRPCPPRSGPDNRIEACDNILNIINSAVPNMQMIHQTGTHLPQECSQIASHDFASGNMFWSGVPGYREWRDRADVTPTMRYHKLHLQVLNHQNPGKHWVLKDPMHIVRVEAILNVYPDARFIQTHRPIEVSLASFASLLYNVQNSIPGEHNAAVRKELGKNLTEEYAGALNLLVETRKSRPELKDRFYDLDFSTFSNDPLQAVKDIYQHFDMTLSAEAEKRMARFVSNNKREKHGKHDYTAEMYGIDKDFVEQSFRPYFDYLSELKTA